MDNVKAYVRKNPVFIALLSVILLISVGLGAYYVMNHRGTSDTKDTEQDVEPEATKAVINSFEGSYNSSKDVILNWSISSNKDKIISVQLFHDDTMIADVTSLNSYTLPQSVYGFAGGTNEFELLIQTENNEEIKRTTSVNVDYLTNVKFTTETTDTGMVLKLQYTYDKNQKISIPRISVFGAQNKYTFNYKDTEKEESGSNILATTTYEMVTVSADVTETIKIRWFFESLNANYDFSLKVQGKNPAKENEKQVKDKSE